MQRRPFTGQPYNSAIWEKKIKESLGISLYANKIAGIYLSFPFGLPMHNVFNFDLRTQLSLQLHYNLYGMGLYKELKLKEVGLLLPSD